MITEKEIRDMALLSKLEIKNEEMPEYIREMEDLIEHIKAVDALVTDSTHNLRNIENFEKLREDAVGESLDTEEVLLNSQGAADGFVKLRKRA